MTNTPDISKEAVEAMATMLDDEIGRLCGCRSKEATTLRAQAARIAELEEEAVKTRGYRVGHIAGFHAGIRHAAKRYREGDDWDVFATADCAILDLIAKDTP